MTDSNSNDPYEILRDLNPVKLEDLGAPASSPAAQAALERILREKQERRLARHFRRRPTHVLLFAVVACGVVAAAAWALTLGGGQRRTVGCYRAVDLHAPIFIAPVHGSPTSTCLSVWRRGELGVQRPSRLDACILDSGAIGVFPGGSGDACAKLHLVAYNRELSTADASRVAKLKDDLVTAFLSYRCLSGRQATAIIRRELLRRGLGDWSITRNGRFTTQARCASVAVEASADTVAIVPVPKP
jgi:hypothetical protein